MIRQILKFFIIGIVALGTIAFAFFSLLFGGVVLFLSGLFGSRKNQSYGRESKEETVPEPSAEDAEENKGKVRRVQHYNGDDIIDV